MYIQREIIWQCFAPPGYRLVLMGKYRQSVNPRLFRSVGRISLPPFLSPHLVSGDTTNDLFRCHHKTIALLSNRKACFQCLTLFHGETTTTSQCSLLIEQGSSVVVTVRFCLSLCCSRSSAASGAVKLSRFVVLFVYQLKLEFKFFLYIHILLTVHLDITSGR